MRKPTREFKLNKPYPRVAVERINLFYAALLTNDYAGTDSELSALNTYLYQHLISTDPIVSEALLSIALTELNHLKTLGRLILLLGGKPRFAVQSGGNCRCWNAQNICYETNPAAFLKENIVSEKASLTNYKTRLTQIADKAVKKCLERIIADEEHHIAIFTELLARLDG